MEAVEEALRHLEEQAVAVQAVSLPGLPAAMV
jgi:hypothetical protein